MIIVGVMVNPVGFSREVAVALGEETTAMPRQRWRVLEVVEGTSIESDRARQSHSAWNDLNAFCPSPRFFYTPISSSWSVRRDFIERKIRYKHNIFYYCNARRNNPLACSSLYGYFIPAPFSVPRTRLNLCFLWPPPYHYHHPSPYRRATTAADVVVPRRPTLPSR